MNNDSSHQFQKEKVEPSFSNLASANNIVALISFWSDSDLGKSSQSMIQTVQGTRKFSCAFDSHSEFGALLTLDWFASGISAQRAAALLEKHSAKSKLTVLAIEPLTLPFFKLSIGHLLSIASSVLARLSPFVKDFSVEEGKLRVEKLKDEFGEVIGLANIEDLLAPSRWSNPVFMLGLFQFSPYACYPVDSKEAQEAPTPSGEKVYTERYGNASIKQVLRTGAYPSILTRTIETVIRSKGANAIEDQLWNEISIVFFPSRMHFVGLTTDPSYMPHFYHRQAALKAGFVVPIW